MHKSLLNMLVDPITKTPLQVRVCERGVAGSMVTGTLHSPQGTSYAITQGIPRFVLTEDHDQKQTEQSFSYKWHQQNTYDSPQRHATARQWLLQRYGFAHLEDMRRFFGTRQRILDAGCGSGFSTSLWMHARWREQDTTEWFGVDISTAIDVAQERLGAMPGTHFLQADLLQLPFLESTFDTIFSEGVLHHTPSTELALRRLVPLLQPEGQMLFYVYRKKGPIREFTDDYLRSVLSRLAPEAAWQRLRPLTRLAQALAELHAEVEVPEDIPDLGIKAGRYDVQRLLYWHFAKVFWNEDLSFEENTHVNFDWYHPRYAHRQTEEEVRRWCTEAGLGIVHFDVQESGFTVRAIKR
jgi:SAM-dependent methyltransferase